MKYFLLGTNERVDQRESTIYQVSEVKSEIIMIEGAEDIGQIQIDQRKYNVTTLLRNSNATPIILGKTHSFCPYCNSEFSLIKDLKIHILTEHKPLQTIPDCWMLLDVTDLTCMQCFFEITCLGNLLVHLNKEHNIFLYTDVPNRILPFKFDPDGLKCGVCLYPDRYFSSLFRHVQSHFTRVNLPE